MTREDSKIMQGVAILMMIFYHLFTPSLVPAYQGSTIGEWAQVQNPVPLYTLLSGYGLYCVYRQGGKDHHLFSRCLRLYTRYWLITACFVALCLCADLMGGVNWLDYPLNILGLKSNFYPASWFILPYCILALSYPLLFRVLDRIGSIAGLIVAYLVYMAMAFAIGHGGAFFGTNIMQVFYIFFPFILGAVTAKCSLVDKAKKMSRQAHAIVPWLALVAWVVVRRYVPTGAFAALYAFGLAVIVSAMRRPAWLNKMLLAFGRQSVGMWFVHWWVFWKIGQQFTYSLQSPILIMLFVTLASYLLAMVFDKMYNMLFKRKKTPIKW